MNWRRGPGLPSGLLRDRVTIQTSTAGSADANGYNIVTWANLAATPTVWAKIDDTSGMVYWQGQQLTPETTHVVTIRRRMDVKPEMRIQWTVGSVTHTAYIKASLTDYGRMKESTILHCKERIVD